MEDNEMTINLSLPITHELKPRITVVGVGGAGGNAINNMITAHLEGVEFVACNTDAQALGNCLTDRRIQLGTTVTHGLGAGARPEVGRAAARRAWTRSWTSSPAATWCSSPPAWAAAPAPGRHP